MSDSGPPCSAKSAPMAKCVLQPWPDGGHYFRATCSLRFGAQRRQHRLRPCMRRLLRSVDEWGSPMAGPKFDQPDKGPNRGRSRPSFGRYTRLRFRSRSRPHAIRHRGGTSKAIGSHRAGHTMIREDACLARVRSSSAVFRANIRSVESPAGRPPSTTCSRPADPHRAPSETTGRFPHGGRWSKERRWRHKHGEGATHSPTAVVNKWSSHHMDDASVTSQCWKSTGLLSFAVAGHPPAPTERSETTYICM